MLLAAQNGLSTASIIFTSSFHKARSSLYSWCFSFLLPWSSFHLSSPFSLTHSTPHTQLTKGDLGAECTPPCPSNGPSFCSLSVAGHLAGCLFTSSAYSAKACHLGRFQPSNSRKRSEDSVWKWRHVIDTCYKSTVYVMSMNLVPASLSSDTKIRKDDTQQHKGSPSNNQEADMLCRTIGKLPSRLSDITFSSSSVLSRKGREWLLTFLRLAH